MAEREKRLSTLWTKHITDEKERAQFRETVQHSTLVLGRLRKILEDKIEDAEAYRLSKDRYNLKAWSYHQADCNGVIRTLKEVVDLLPKE